MKARVIDSVPFRLLKVIGLGAFVLAAVIGSIWLSRTDRLMTAHPAPGSYTLPTPTLFPTQLPTKEASEPEAASTSGAPTETAVTAEPVEIRPSETPPSTTVQEPEPCVVPMGWVAYTVRAGDTFYDLARQGQTNLQALLQGNCLTEVRALESGELIYLPAIAQATPTLAAPVCGAPPGWPIVIVKRGETLYALAVRYGTTVAALRQANCLSGDLVKAGDPLFVPPHIVVPPTAIPTVVWWTPTPLPTAIPTASPTEPMPTETALPSETPTATVEPSPTPTPTETPVLVPTWTPVVWTTPTPTPTVPLPTSTSTPSATPAP